MNENTKPFLTKDCVINTIFKFNKNERFLIKRELKIKKIFNKLTKDERSKIQ